MQIFKSLKSGRRLSGSLHFGAIALFSNHVDTSKEWYKILNLEKNATTEDIKKSYYTLAKKYHPDVHKGSDEHFKEINRAYEILSNDETRKAYDQFQAGDRYSSSTQSRYKNYHYGAHMKGQYRYNRPWEAYYNAYEAGRAKKNEDQFFYNSTYSRARTAKEEYDRRRWYQFYQENQENRGTTYDDINVGRREYDLFVKKMLFYPMVFMFFYFLLFFLPSRNISKEYVLFDENTGKVYVTDRQTYEEMKQNSLKNPSQYPQGKHPPHLQMRRDFQAEKSF